ncbi:MAG TPA: sensor histidine kinase, partial [Maritimibacter sp.]|nr:sensor histidine kinase [Maritimibacter sp.]
MKSLVKSWEARTNWLASKDREQRIKDYIILSNKLIWQRQASFLAAAILAAFYFDPYSTIILYVVVFLTEILDQLLGFRAKAWDGKDPAVGRQLLKRITINTAISAVAIGAFIINIAIQQTSGGHFTPLFFLISASLFAAMYNSQIISVLLVRLSIYGVTFVFIAFLDVVRYRPPLSSTIWLEFFTVVFVLYFIVDTSIKFYRGYQERLEQIKLIHEENERTKAAYEIKSQFLSTVSHELRTPLTSIKASIDLVNSGVLGKIPDEMVSPLSIAAKNGHRLANLIDDLLDLQKIEAGEMRFQFETVSANELIKDSIEAVSGYAEKLGIHVVAEDASEEYLIRGDYYRLIQVMNNLLSNAIKFTETGSVALFVDVIPHRSGKAVLSLKVRDTGPGIPISQQLRLFERFSQANASVTRMHGGTGLGLAISRHICELMGGEISLRSKPGEGAEFHAKIMVEISEDRPVHAGILSAAAAGLSFSGLRILAAEDNRTHQ